MATFEISIPISVSPIVGDTIVVALAYGQSANSTSLVADGDLTFFKIPKIVNGTNIATEMYWAQGWPSEGVTELTLTVDSATEPEVLNFQRAYSKINEEGSATDVAESAFGTGNTATIGPTPSTSSARQIWIATIANDLGHTVHSPTNDFDIISQINTGTGTGNFGLTFMERTVDFISTVETSANFVSAEWGMLAVTLVSSDDAPELSLLDPAPNEVAAEDTNISFEIDGRDGVSPPDVTIQVNAGPVQDAVIDGVIQSGFDGPESLSYAFDREVDDGYGFVLDTTTLFSVGDTVAVNITSFNSFGTAVNALYYFYVEDLLPPTIENLDPNVDATNVQPTSNIAFDIIDTGSGVDLGELNVTIGARPAIVNGVIQNAFLGELSEGFTGTIGAITNGYSVEIDPKFVLNFGEQYDVSIDGYDLDGYIQDNQVNFEYSFTVGAGTQLLSAVNEPYNNRITLTFSADMTQDAVLLDPSNYKIRGDAYVSSVNADPLLLDQVELTADDLFGQETFEVVALNITDAYGVTLDNRFNSAILTLENPNGIDISGISGSLKTKNDINDIYGDSERWYAATAAGVDVINNQTLLNVGFLIDAYGVSHITADSTNVYYASNNASDSYGIYKVPIINFVGETTTSTKLLDGYTVNNMASNDNDIVAIATASGAVTLKGTAVTTYAAGNDIVDAAIDSTGSTLYLANNTLGRVEVYYNIDVDGYDRSTPDFYYSTATTPAIVSGTLNAIAVTSDTSVVSLDSNTIYVATDGGVTKIDTDESNLTVSEVNGVATSYGVAGSGLDYDILDGDTNNATLVDANAEQLQMFIVTDEAGFDGGFHIVNLSSNALLRFIPENDLPGTTSALFFKQLVSRPV